MSIEIANIKKSFGRTQVLNDISLDIPSGQMVALLGPSGSGKTTLLRIIAGLEHQTSGHIRFHGTDVSRMHARDRKVGFVFQHYALFRHMTVFDNIAFGLTVLPRRERPNAAAIKAKVTKLLEMVQLAHLADRYPAQLSGGQKQRVALARALAVEPQILLLDEPFGALDAQVRKELRRWLRQLHEELKFTSVFVTHDQEEAMEVADRVVVMSPRPGRIDPEPRRLRRAAGGERPGACARWREQCGALLAEVRTARRQLRQSRRPHRADRLCRGPGLHRVGGQRSRDALHRRADANGEGAVVARHDDGRVRRQHAEMA